MDSLKKIIVKPSTLSGEIKISGAKNSVLRILATSILTSEEIFLENYPAGLLDAKVHVEMLECLGKNCSQANETISIKESKSLSDFLDYDGRSIRNTLLILGALTARKGRGSVPLPGGCKLGERKHDLHIMLLENLGAKVWESGDRIYAEAPTGGLIGADIFLPFRSTGATENAIICGTLARGITRIWNPHIRPEIIDLINLLIKMGAEIEIRGQESIIVKGKEGLNGCKHYVMPDNIEALTWLVGCAITGGDLLLHDFPFEHLEVPLIYLRESGIKLYKEGSSAIIRGGNLFPLDISTGPYPGINSDMQPILAIMGAVAKGKSHIIDLRFPGRYGYMKELCKMGVEYKISDNLLEINGGNPLKGCEVSALDLRAGASLLLAGLIADGETHINEAWQIERGYDGLIAKLNKLGVKYSEN